MIHRLWARAYLKWKTIRRSDELKLDIVFGNHWRCVLPTKERRDCLTSYRHTVQKPASLIAQGCISGQEMHYHCWKVQRCFRTTVSFRRGLACLSEIVLYHILHPSQQCGFTVRVRVLNWPACSPQLSPRENISAKHETKYTAKKVQECRAARVLPQTRTGTFLPHISS